MSRVVEYDIPCPKCKNIDKYKVYHSINMMMTPDAVERIYEDNINFFTCSICSNKFQVKCSLFFVNNEKQYCLHYLPDGVKDENISEVKNKLIRMFGENYFLANPIVFNDWSNFKNEIITKENVQTNKQIESGLKFVDYVFNRLKRNKTIYSSVSWSCNICDGDETTGCLYHDQSECPKFS